MNKEKVINEVKEIMKKQGYREVIKLLYYKMKNKKGVENGCFRIGNKYFYFLK